MQEAKINVTADDFLALREFSAAIDRCARQFYCAFPHLGPGISASLITTALRAAHQDTDDIDAVVAAFHYSVKAEFPSHVIPAHYARLLDGVEPEAKAEAQRVVAEANLRLSKPIGEC